MKKSVIFFLTFISLTAYAQSTNCACFNGIGSLENDAPKMTLELSETISLNVCGYEHERYGEDETLISEFNVFNCETGEALVTYGALQNCIVLKVDDRLDIKELRNLPSGKDWEWQSVQIALQQIYLKENEIFVSKREPVLKEFKIDKTATDQFLKSLKKLKGKGILQNPDEIIGRLEFLAINEDKKAIKILKDFKNYFNYTVDGSVAEQLNEALANLAWLKN